MSFIHEVLQCLYVMTWLFSCAAAVSLGLHCGLTLAARWFGPIRFNTTQTTNINIDDATLAKARETLK